MGKSSRACLIAWMLATTSLVAQAQAQSSAAAGCDAVAQSASQGAEREKTEVDRKVFDPAKQGLDAANSCMARIGGALMRMMPGVPTFSVLTPDQILKMLADKACNVASAAATKAVSPVTDQINRQIQAATGKVVGAASKVPGVDGSVIYQDGTYRPAVNLPSSPKSTTTTAPAPVSRSVTVPISPAKPPPSGNQSPSVFDKISGLFGK